MNNIPTAEEFFEQTGTYPELAIKFAQLHVEAALKAASEKATMKTSYPDEGYKQSEESGLKFVNVHDIDRGGESGNVTIEEESILNAYSLENIK